MKRVGRALGMAMFAGLCAAWVAEAAEQKTLELTPRLLLSHFGLYPSSTKSIKIDAQALRFFLSSSAKKPEQIGLYSFFAMAGDFEVTAHYEWTPVAVPKDGYGVSCGIAIDTDTKTVALARGNFVCICDALNSSPLGRSRGWMAA